MVETLDDGLDGLFGHQRGVLADGGEIDEGQPGNLAVVVADYRYITGNVDAGPGEGVEDAVGAPVICRDDERPARGTKHSDGPVQGGGLGHCARHVPGPFGKKIFRPVNGIAAVCVFGWEEDADAIHRRMLDRVTSELAGPSRQSR